MSLLVDITTISPELAKLIAVAFLELHGKAEIDCYEQMAPFYLDNALSKGGHGAR